LPLLQAKGKTAANIKAPDLRADAGSRPASFTQVETVFPNREAATRTRHQSLPAFSAPHSRLSLTAEEPVALWTRSQVR